MLPELSDIGYTVIINSNRTEVKIDLTHLFATLTLLHSQPILEGAVNQCLRRNGNDCVIKVPYLDCCQTDLLYPSVGTSSGHSRCW